MDESSFLSEYLSDDEDLFLEEPSAVLLGGKKNFFQYNPARQQMIRHKADRFLYNMKAILLFILIFAFYTVVTTASFANVAKESNVPIIPVLAVLGIVGLLHTLYEAKDPLKEVFLLSKPELDVESSFEQKEEVMALWALRSGHTLIYVVALVFWLLTGKQSDQDVIDLSGWVMMTAMGTAVLFPIYFYLWPSMVLFISLSGESENKSERECVLN